MKTFDELTDEEVLALTSEEVQRYIDRESAEAGIPLLVPPGPKPDASALQPDLLLFSVGGLYFSNRQDALRVLDTLAVCPSRHDLSYVSGPSYQQKGTPSDNDLSIAEIRVLSEQTANNRAAAIAESERAKKQWEIRNSAYQSAQIKRRQIAEEITERRARLQDREIERIQVREQHARYLDLADGNRRTAARFLLAALPKAKMLCPELFEFRADEPADVPLSSKRYYQPAEEVAAGDEL